MPARRRSKRSFGGLRRLPSGRYQANYTGPDGRVRNAPVTFETKEDAEGWLTDRRREVKGGTWEPPSAVAKPLTFREYADAWLIDRVLKPRTREHYRALLDQRLLPTFGDIALTAITPAMVGRWHTLEGASTPTMRSHAYALLRTILTSAVHDQLLASNPCHIRGAGNSTRVHKIKPLTLPELETLVAAMPARYRAMTLLAAWGALRFGELTELRRSDLDLKNGVIRIRRAVVRADGETIVTTPKSDAGTRDVAVPPHLLPTLRMHVKTHAAFGRDGLVFPSASGGHLAPSAFYGKAPTKTRVGFGFYAARVAAGRPDLRFHDLRHTGAVLAASTGATLAELMGRLGHSTPGAALRYQHAVSDRDRAIAAALSDLVNGAST
jgi:integrase